MTSSGSNFDFDFFRRCLLGLGFGRGRLGFKLGSKRLGENLALFRLTLTGLGSENTNHSST